MYSFKYEGIVCWLDQGEHHKEGTFCISCSTKNELNRLFKIESVQWKEQWKCV